jgi:hypothetical protein
MIPQINENLLRHAGFESHRHVEQIAPDVAVGITLWSHPHRPEVVLFYYRPGRARPFWAMSMRYKAFKTLITTGKNIEDGGLLGYSEVKDIPDFFTKQSRYL